MKKIISIVIVLTFMTALTGCTLTENKKTVQVKAYQVGETVDSQSSSNDSNQKDGEVKDSTVNKAIVPKGNAGVADDVPLNSIVLYGNPITFQDMTVEQLSKDAGAICYPDKELLIDTNDFYFQGKGFSINDTDSVFFVEVTDGNNLITQFDEAKFSSYKVKAIGVSLKNVQNGNNNFASFCGGLSLGTSKQEIESLFGEGTIINTNTSIYKNANYSFVVTYENNTAETIILVLNK